MSFQTRTAIPGELETASDYNVYVRDPLNATYAGAKALTGQTALDMFYALSATQEARIAAVAGAMPHVKADGSGWDMHRLAYTPTLANVQNTAVKTAAVSVTIPANDLSNGSVISMMIAALVKNNKGSPGTVLFGLAYAGVADASPTNGPVSYTDIATEYPVLWRFVMQRAGADLWVNVNTYVTGNPDALVAVPDAAFTLDPSVVGAGAFAGGNARKITAPDFTTDQTLALNITLSAADANFYIKPQSAHVRRHSL